MAIHHGIKVEPIVELRNSWGSAPVVWDALSQRYLNKKPHTYLFDNAALWDLWKHLAIPEEYRMVLMLTFDKAYVASANYPRMAAAISKFLADFELPPENVNHWPAIKSLFENSPEIPGIGLYCTSVSENMFYGPWNEEKEDYDPPDWSTIYELCEEIDSLTQATTV